MAPATLKERIIARLLRDGKEQWFIFQNFDIQYSLPSNRMNIWSGRQILWIPLDLRLWMFHYGSMLNPSLVMETTTVYWENLQRITRNLQTQIFDSEPPTKRRKMYVSLLFPAQLILALAHLHVTRLCSLMIRYMAKP